MDESVQDLIAKASGARDGRGLIPADLAASVRRVVVGEAYEAFDTIVIGPGARDVDDGWFNTWAQFAAAENLVWFGRRSSNAGHSYTNHPFENTDFASDFYQSGAEFICPVGMSERETVEEDGELMPILFHHELPTLMPLSFQIGQADEMLRVPANHAPAGYGIAGGVVSAFAAPIVVPGLQGVAMTSNTWKWPEPLMLPAKTTFIVSGRTDQPLRAALANMPGPGYKVFVVGQTEYLIPNWYRIRLFHKGPRYLQLRGARSAAGATGG